MGRHLVVLCIPGWAWPLLWQGSSRRAKGLELKDEVMLHEGPYIMEQSAREGQVDKSVLYLKIILFKSVWLSFFGALLTDNLQLFLNMCCDMIYIMYQF